MQADTTPILPSKKSTFSFILSLFSILAVIGAYIWLFFYSIAIENGIREKKDAIAKIDTQINDISKDQDIIIRKILLSNTIRPSIDLVGLIKEFRDAGNRAKVRLKWFSVKDDIISTSLISTEWDPTVHPDPVATIIKMMREYDAGHQYFTLDPISSISWDATKRTTDIAFHIQSK